MSDRTKLRHARTWRHGAMSWNEMRPPTEGGLASLVLAKPQSRRFLSALIAQPRWHVGFTPGSGRIAAPQRADAMGQYRKSHDVKFATTPSAREVIRF
jgi:hypothetical protein